jgi:hypothetical protein
MFNQCPNFTDSIVTEMKRVINKDRKAIQFVDSKEGI